MKTSSNMNMSAAIDTTIETPPQGTIPSADLMPPSKPQAVQCKDVQMCDAAEVDVSCLAVPDIDTLPMTLGSQRPIQGYRPLGDLPLLRQFNDQEFTIKEHPLPADQEQFSLSMAVKGLNIFNPLSLPPVDDTTLASEADLATAIFGNNGPSIATPGSAKRAAVEQSASTIKSVIVKAFNRSIPFTDFGPATRTEMLASYEAELGKIQLFFQAIDTLRGYAEFLSKNGIMLDDSWLPLYSPDVYTALVSVYNSVQDLLVYDSTFHDRIEKLARPFTVSKRVAAPATCIMQDALVAQLAATTTVKAGNNSFTFTHPVPNYSLVEWWAKLLTSEDSAYQAVRTMSQAIKSVRTDYEIVITALAQLVSKRALAEKHLREYIPAQPTAAGFLQFADSEPGFSYAYHERWEYAPETIYGEVGASNTKSTWSIHKLPGYNGSARPSECMSLRPVGKNHGSESFKIAEVIDIGLFKDASDSGYIGKLAKNEYKTGTVGPLSLNTSPGAQYCSLFVDAVYGDLYADGNVPADGVGQQLRGSSFGMHGMSMYAAGTGLHNILAAPILIGITTASQTTIPGVDIVVSSLGGVAYMVGFKNPVVTNTTDAADLQSSTIFAGYLMEELDLAVLVHPREATEGVRDLPATFYRGYAMAGYYSYSLAAVDNAVGSVYTALIPEMVINFATR